MRRVISTLVSNKRIEYIDLAKALGIILVIAGHVVSSDTVIKRVIYSFHMPLFFIISGMLLNVREEYSIETWRNLITKKAMVLLLPFIFWGLIYASFSFKHMALILYGTRETLVAAESLTSLWFLPVLFLAFLLTEVFLQFISKTKKQWTSISLGIFVFVIIGFVFPHLPQYGDPWGLDIAFVAASFMLVGMLAKKGIEQLQIMPKMRIIALLSNLLLFAVLVHYSNSSVGYVLMANAEYGNVIQFYICALSGSAMVLMISSFLSDIHIGWLQSIGQKTLGIFLVHKPFAELGRSIITKIGFRFDNPIFIILITAVTLFVSYIIVTIIQMIVPEIIGQKRKIEREIP